MSDDKETIADCFGIGFGGVVEKFQSGEYELPERTIMEKLRAAWRKLSRGFWDALSELGYERGL
jgi:hypothetical protein